VSAEDQANDMVRAVFFKAVLANDTGDTTATMRLPMTMGGCLAFYTSPAYLGALFR
jgi:hypothetical protein